MIGHRLGTGCSRVARFALLSVSLSLAAGTFPEPVGAQPATGEIVVRLESDHTLPRASPLEIQIRPDGSVILRVDERVATARQVAIAFDIVELTLANPPEGSPGAIRITPPPVPEGMAQRESIVDSMAAGYLQSLKRQVAARGSDSERKAILTVVRAKRVPMGRIRSGPPRTSEIELVRHPVAS